MREAIGCCLDSQDVSFVHAASSREGRGSPDASRSALVGATGIKPREKPRPRSLR